MSSNGIDRSVNTSFPKLGFNSSKKVGGDKVLGGNNIQFETITPNIEHLVFTNTSLSASIRTVSGTSINGTASLKIRVMRVLLLEFQIISLLQGSLLLKNEDVLLTDLPGNKSLTLDLEFGSDNSFVSPLLILIE